MMKTLLIAILFLPFSANAADLYLEPYLGYHTNANFKFSSGSSSSAGGLTYGGRVGADYMDLLLGVDYMTGSWKNNNNSITPSNLGVFVGYKFPVMIKVYGTYFFDEKYKFSGNGSSNDYGGTEFKFGLAFTTLPVITFGIEYAMGTLTTSNGSSMQNADVSYFGFVIGVPLEY